MPRFARSLFCALALVTAPLADGCAATHGASALDVEASIASVTLADDCAERAGLVEPAEGDCAPGFDGCGGWCTQTGVQLAIDAAEGDTSVPFEVVAIRLRAMDGRLLDELDARSAQLFADDGYVAWDERIAPGDHLRVRYDTSAPDWAAIAGGSAWETYGMQFRLEMVVRVDGVERTIELAPVSREPEIVT